MSDLQASGSPQGKEKVGPATVRKYYPPDETVAVSRQGGSRRSIRLGWVNFWSGKLRCTESKN